ncbi:hypothetical protein LG198_11115, partial [Methylobacillus arboreus]|uniref:hypothetical protein n=1 Tax=Methylobacillus arboreus TaxID=755170 RepID=UPI001E399AA6
LSINGTLDLRNLMLSQVLGHDNALNTDKVFLTYSLFDQRNQLTKTIQPGMEGWSSTAVIETNANGQSTVVRAPSNGTVSANSLENPVLAGAINAGFTTVTWNRLQPVLAFSGGNLIAGGRIRVEVNIPGEDYIGSFYSSYGANHVDISSPYGFYYHISHGDAGWGNPGPHPYSVFFKIYYQTDIGEVFVTQTPSSAVNGTVEFSLPKNIYITNQPTTTSKLLLSYRPRGSNDAYTTVSVPQMVNTTGAAMTGMYAFDWSSLTPGDYEYQYFALNSAGEILNAQGGTFNTTNASAPTVSPQTPLLTSGAGGAIVTNPAGVITTNAIAHPTFNITLTGNSVKKTGGGNAWGDADAISMESFTGGAYVSAQAGQTNLAGMFGLNADPTANKSYNTLDYAWYPTAGGILQIYENGSYAGDYGTYTPSDVLAVEYVGTTVRYLKNGVVMRTVNTTANRTFYFDSSFNSVGFALNHIFFGSSAANATDINFNTTSLTKVGNSSAGWDTDAYSSHAYTGNAYVSAQAGQTNLHGMFGLNADPSRDKSYTSLDYAWYPTSSGTLQIYESGTLIGNFGSYTTSDVLAVEYVGTDVRYLKNGAVIRTVNTNANRTFYFDSSFHNHNFTLNNLKFGATAETASSQLINPQSPQLNFIGQGITAASLALRYRVKGSGGGWSEVPSSSFVAGFFGVGSFTLPTSALGVFVNAVEYDLELDVRDASGDLIRTSTGSLSRDANGNLSVGALTVPPTLTFHQGEEASTLKLRYRVAGSTDSYSAPITLTAGSVAGQFTWNPAALVPDWNSTYAYEFDIEAYDANGWLIRHNRTDITLGSPITIGTTQALSVTSLTVTP